MEEEDRGRMWRLYGWFTALMACGSCFGTVVWAARMMAVTNFFKGFASRNLSQQTSLLALGYSWRSAFLATYAIEFLCLSAANFMVLDRLLVFAAPEGSTMRKRWVAAGRVVMAAVVLGNAVGLAANAAAAVQFQKAAQAASTASEHYAANRTTDGKLFYSLSQEAVQHGGSIAAVQMFCEVAVLLLIVVAFVAAGVLSARRVNTGLLDVDAASAAAATGRALRRRMLGTTAFVFVAFVLRAAFAIMFAVAFQFREIGKSCPADPCGQCHNSYHHITQWMLHTPEFQPMIVLISSPVALLVALWGMTPKSMLQVMKSSKQEYLFPLKPVNNALRK